MITVADIVAHRRRTEKLVERIASAWMPTEFGEFVAHGYRSIIDGQQHVALAMGDVDGGEEVLVRVHSECLTGDVFHSMRCDCGEQAAAGARPDRGRGPGCAPLPVPGRPRHRPAEQAPGLRVAGARHGHGRRQPGTRPARRLARLRHRLSDPVRPGDQVDAGPDEQSPQDHGPRGLRAADHRAGARSRRRRTRSTSATCARRSSGWVTPSATRGSAWTSDERSAGPASFGSRWAARP